MPENQLSQTLESIIEKVLKYKDSVGGIDDSKFASFLKSVVNGDANNILSHLVISASYGEKDEDCVILYILTRGKFIKIRIIKDGFTSSSAYLNQITGVNKSVIEGDRDRSSVSVEYPQGKIGLTYSTDIQIDNFFEQVDREVQAQSKVQGQ